MMRKITGLMLAIGLGIAGVQAVAADTGARTTEKELFAYLDQSILWYRHVAGAETANISSREMLLRNTLQQSALKALRYSFDFARIQGDILQEAMNAENEALKKEQEEAAQTPSAAPAPSAPEPSAEAEEQQFNPAQAKVNIATKIDDVQKQINAADAELVRTPRSKRDVIQAKRDKLVAELNLAKTQQGLIDTILTMSESEKQETIGGQIDNLAKAIPELAQVKKAAANGTAASPPASSSDTAATVNPLQLLTGGSPVTPDNAVSNDDGSTESKGVIGLIGELITRSHQKQDLADLLDETSAMQKANEQKIAQQRDRLIEIVRRSKDLSQKSENAADTLMQQGQELTQLNDDFKNVSDIIVPLSKQRISLRNSAQTIHNWQGIFTDEMSQIAKRLVTRIITLAILLTVPFLISELARRAVSQYVQDARRRRQMNIIRRVVVGILVALIALLNLTSEFGSMATIIGFVTAGLAVALQNVILSVVAFFFFFGRFGLKVGSRVTVGAVTGDVVETGFVRLYLMELTDEKGQLRPTGRIVAFPNSIIFQPLAFFKQVPGVNYRWHEITYTLEASTDRALAETKLRELVDSVYKDNKGMIDMQKAALEQSTRLRVKEPRPEGKVEKTPEGLTIVVRYPIDTESADTTDKSVMRQASEIFERLPSVKRINDEPPVIKRK